MKFFEAVPSELFSPLASPNRMLYADALDVLYSAYRENLKIREDVLYSMLRSRLEQQLADATFEGEDIDEEEFRDISGRARFLIRKLCSKGWFEKERGDDFEEYITVPSYSSRLLELFHQLREDSPVRGYSYVFGTFVEQFHPHGLARSETYLSALRTDLENGKYVQFRNAIEKILEYGVTIEQGVFLG